MSKIWLVIKREYLSRVRKKSFIIMTILGPILMAAFYAVLIFIALSEEERPHTVMVVDNSSLKLGDELKKYNVLHPAGKLHFVWKYDDYWEAIDHIEKEDYQSVLMLPTDPVTHPGSIVLKYKDRPGSSTVKTIESELDKIIQGVLLAKNNITEEQLAEIMQKKVSLKTSDISVRDMEGKDETAQYIIAIAFGFLIYMFILLYGVQVFRGVMEEKTNRIVEVIISSVRPFQIMMGKIIGIALVGLTQFLIWVIFSGTVITILSAVLAPTVMQQVETGDMNMHSEIGGVNTGQFFMAADMANLFVLLPLFVFYFLGGYLLYASLFAAIGAAVDSETDSQQFMLPITMPLILSFVIAQMALNDPEGNVATIFSMIPLTSPIVMMVRLPFMKGADIWQLFVSMGLLVAGFVFTTWIAARIYRTGILMYGKKVTYKELFKWLFYKN